MGRGRTSYPHSILRSRWDMGLVLGGKAPAKAGLHHDNSVMGCSGCVRTFFTIDCEDADGLRNYMLIATTSGRSRPMVWSIAPTWAPSRKPRASVRSVRLSV